MSTTIAFSCEKHEESYISWVLFKSEKDFESREEAIESLAGYLFSRFKIDFYAYVELQKCSYCEKATTPHCPQCGMKISNLNYTEEDFKEYIVRLHTVKNHEFSEDYSDHEDEWGLNEDIFTSPTKFYSIPSGAEEILLGLVSPYFPIDMS